MKQPAWFLAHGAPFHAVGEHPLARFWASLPQRLERRPRAILSISAHWQAAQPTLSGTTAAPAIQHDFYGFPDELDRLRWPLPDGVETGRWLAQQLQQAGLRLTTESERPFDHGVWTPLMRAWPIMDIPVFQLSLVNGWQGQEYLALGEAITQLRAQNVLIIGSGSITHNLQALDMQAEPGIAMEWAAAFMAGIETAIADRNITTLAEPWRLQHGKQALPTLEHYWPLLPIIAASEKPLTPLLREWAYGSLALHSYSTTD